MVTLSRGHAAAHAGRHPGGPAVAAARRLAPHEVEERPLRVLVISGAFPPAASGEAANTYHLCARLAQAGAEVHVLTTSRPEPTPLPGVTLHPLMARWSWREIPALVRVVRRIRPNGILLMYLGAIYGYHPAVTFLPTLFKRIFPHSRFVTRFENPMSAARPELFGWSGRMARAIVSYLSGRGASYSLGTLLRDSDHVIALCEHHMTLLRQLDASIARKTVLIPPPPNVAVIADPDGIRRAEGRRSIGARNGTLVVGYLGYLYRNKGVETLLRGVSEAIARGLDVRMVVLGGPPDVGGIEDGPVSYYDQVRALAGELGLRDRVRWAGAFSTITDAVASYIHGVDVFVLPFDHGIHLNNSSFASVASYGVPVVATRQEHTDKAFVDRGNVLLCPPRDPVAIADALLEIAARPELLAGLRRGIRTLAAEKFSWDRAIDQTLSLLEEPRMPVASGAA